MQILTSLLTLVVLARVLGHLFTRWGQPAIVGEMLAGILLGPAVLGLVAPNPALSGIASLAIFLVVLDAGLEMSFQDVQAAMRGCGFIVAMVAFFLPFGAGTAVAWAFDQDLMRTIQHRVGARLHRPGHVLGAGADGRGDHAAGADLVQRHRGPQDAGALPRDRAVVRTCAQPDFQTFVSLQPPESRPHARTANAVRLESLIEIAVEVRGDQLRLVPLDDSGALLRKHFLQLDGLGIRDLHFSGDDLYILAGPTMVLNGEIRLFKWQAARPLLAANREPVRFEEALTSSVSLPHGRGTNRAEAICALPAALSGAEASWLVLYDAPGANRKEGEHTVFGDLVRHG